MEQRDYLKEQIDQLGWVLGEMVARFFPTRPEGDIEHALNITNELLRGE